MAGDGAQFGGVEPSRTLASGVARLPQLRGEGLRLVSEGDIAEVEAWHGRWAVLLDEIRAQLDLEAPRKSELVLWPAVNGAQPLGRIRVELVRATVGCRELELLVGELGGSHGEKAEIPEAVLLPEEPRVGATYVGPGRRFEGAIRLRQLIEPAQESLVVVDSYMDGATFALAAAAPDGVDRTPFARPPLMRVQPVVPPCVARRRQPGRASRGCCAGASCCTRSASPR